MGWKFGCPWLRLAEDSRTTDSGCEYSQSSGFTEDSRTLKVCFCYSIYLCLDILCWMGHESLYMFPIILILESCIDVGNERNWCVHGLTKYRQRLIQHQCENSLRSWCVQTFSRACNHSHIASVWLNQICISWFVNRMFTIVCIILLNYVNYNAEKWRHKHPSYITDTYGKIIIYKVVYL